VERQKGRSKKNILLVSKNEIFWASSWWEQFSFHSWSLCALESFLSDEDKFPFFLVDDFFKHFWILNIFLIIIKIIKKIFQPKKSSSSKKLTFRFSFIEKIHSSTIFIFTSHPSSTFPIHEFFSVALTHIHMTVLSAQQVSTIFSLSCSLFYFFLFSFTTEHFIEWKNTESFSLMKKKFFHPLHRKIIK